MVKISIPFALVILLFSCGSNFNQPNLAFTDADSLSLIPFPQSIEKGEGYFKMNEDVYFSFHDKLGEEGWMIMSGFFDTCTESAKENLEPVSGSNICEIILSEDFKVPNNSPDGYELIITHNRLTLTAGTIAGIRYGIQTLWQMRPQTYSEEARAYLLPTLKIVDYPTFKHRGLMLDVCRHFFDIGIVMQYVNVLEHYKMNVLHLHLTEDQGWRMPIDKYPLLNEISSWRLDSNGNKYGGFYSKEDLIELVDYAEERNITIIPEIELP